MSVPRGSAQQGQTVKLGRVMKLGGSLFDPEEVRQVIIYGADGVTALATFTASEITRESLGNYFVEWAIPSSEPSEIHYDTWFATASVGGTEEQDTESFFVHVFSSTVPGASYLTPTEMREFLPGDSTLTDAQLTTMISLAQQSIEEITGQSFLPVTKTVTYDGNARNKLPLGEPILSVSEARIISCGNAETQLDVSQIRISKSKTMLGLGNVGRRSDRFYAPTPFGEGSVGSVFGCNVWPSGFQNVAITGNWGRYESVPQTILGCLIQLVRNAAFCDDPLALPSHAFKSESIPGDRNYTLAEVWQNVKLNNMTGYPDIDRILSRRLAAPTVGFV